MFASTVVRKSGTRFNSTFLNAVLRQEMKTGGDPQQALLGFKARNVCV